MSAHFDLLSSAVITAPDQRETHIIREPELSQPSLPDAILSTLLQVREPEEFRNSNRPIAVHLRAALESQGLSRRALLGKLQWSDNENKTFRYIDAALNGEPCHEPFFRRLFECLGIAEIGYLDIDAEEGAFWELRCIDAKRRGAHNSYRRLGPHLFAISNHNRAYKSGYIDGFYQTAARVPFESTGQTITPLAIGEVARAIVADVKWLCRIDRKFVGAYQYHRLPEEMIIFGVDGRIITRGDSSLCYP
jgi:hypothetical protein